MSTDALPADPSDVTLRCPLCDYDLRGLTENRCPECGHAFDPAALRAAKTERLLWFFEHATRSDGRLRAFATTTFRTFAPGSFWRAIAPAHVIVRLRLALWAIVWFALPLLGVLGAAAASFERIQGSWWVAPNGRFYPNTAFGGGAFGSPANVYVRPDFKQTWQLFQSAWMRTPETSIARTMLAIVVWPLLAVVAMSLFRTTLSRAGVRHAHLRRIAFYAMPPVVTWTFIVAALAVGLQWAPEWPMPDLMRFALDQYRLGGAMQFLLFGAIVVSTVHVCIAHVRYLRLPNALATGLLVQTVAWLGVAVLLFFSGQLR